MLYLTVLICSFTVLMCWLPGTAQDQAAGPYLDPIPLDANYANKNAVRDLETNKLRAVNAKALDDATRETIRAYYQDYLFKFLTHPENYGEWSGHRRRILGELRRSYATSREIHDYLASLVFSSCRPLVEQNYHPVIRLNAMLLIGDLNEQERGVGPEKPLAATLAYMREQVKNPAQIDPVRVAALTGILRHVEAYWVAGEQPAPEVISELTAEMTSLVTSPPPPGRPADVHAWIQARGVDILGSLSGWKPDSAAFQAMQNLLVDSNQPAWLRCRVAYAMSRVKYSELPNADQVDWGAVAGGLAGLLADACKKEQDFLESEKEKLTSRSSVPGVPGVPGEVGGIPGYGAPGEPGLAGAGATGSIGLPPPPGESDVGGGLGFPASGMGGMMPYGPFGSGAKLGGLPKYKVDASRRRMLYGLLCVRAAVQGPAPDADVKGVKSVAQQHPKAGPILQSIERALGELDKSVNAKDVDLEAMLKTLRTRGQEMELFRAQSAPPATNPASDVPGDVPPSDVPASGPP
jgi:hypothetical protein